MSDEITYTPPPRNLQAEWEKRLAEHNLADPDQEMNTTVSRSADNSDWRKSARKNGIDGGIRNERVSCCPQSQLYPDGRTRMGDGRQEISRTFGVCISKVQNVLDSTRESRAVGAGDIPLLSSTKNSRGNCDRSENYHHGSSIDLGAGENGR